MSNSKPIKSKNAIDEIAFMVFFKNEFDDVALDKLFSLREELSGALPDSKVIDSVRLVVDKQSPQLPVTKPGGFVCGKYSATQKDRFEWSLRVDGNRVVVACSEFDDWDIIWPQARNYLFSVVDKFEEISKNPIVEVVFQCTDKFVTQDSETYSARDIFNPDSRYISPNIFMLNDSLWHLHQGWFLYPSNGQVQALHNLNVTAQKQEGSTHETAINHIVRISRADKAPITDKDAFLGSQGADDGYLSATMIEAHKSNKRVLLGLLNAEMLNLIDLQG